MSTILIAEDEDRIATSVAKGLRATGYTPTIATKGTEALQFATQGGVEFRLRDVGPPGIDGFEMLGRARSAGVSVPVIIPPEAARSSSCRGVMPSKADLSISWRVSSP